jgi:hypothetical protein
VSAAIVTRLLREVEWLRDENGRLVALLGYERKPVNPLPLLTGSEIIAVLHPAEARWSQ